MDIASPAQEPTTARSSLVARAEYPYKLRPFKRYTTDVRMMSGTPFSGGYRDAVEAARQLSVETRLAHAVRQDAPSQWTLASMQALFADGAGELSGQPLSLRAGQRLHGPFGLFTWPLRSESVEFHSVDPTLKAIVEQDRLIEF